ncbi:PEP-CTERM sorting domain-containing protein [Pseudobythopirellula maris]|uniref:PEP-CTERM sorting domain-containing protein n=1 Tax=Pseudobythopirellula maris TaxID=2527991 RepID=UPI0018D49A16|nr:PEP-CTERM sorting domain-containing protein [Pseudobythopirellula maris]
MPKLNGQYYPSIYGAPLSVQNTATQYGDATNGDARYAVGGSEIDYVAANVDSGRLNVLVAGNLESNFNKLNIFIDSEPGGMNVVDGANAPAGVDPYCCPGAGTSAGALQGLDGLKFDDGFEADHFLTFSNGEHTFGADPITAWTLTSYYADLTAGPAGKKSEIGFQYQSSGGSPLPGQPSYAPIDQLNNGCLGPDDNACDPPEHEFAEPVDTVNDPTNAKGHRDLLNDVGLLMGIDNSNTQGVEGGAGATMSDPGTARTGLSFSIPLSTINRTLTGVPSPLRLVAFIGNGSHSHVSNQFAGDGVLQGNLGSPAGVDLSAIAGDQFVTVPAAPRIAGDYNGNGTVDAADFTVWRDAVASHTLGGFARMDLTADGNGDFVVDDLDRQFWADRFGDQAPPALTGGVPEPATAWALLAGLIAAAVRRSR